MKRGRKRRKYSRPIVMSATLMDPFGEGGGFVKTYIYHFVTKNPGLNCTLWQAVKERYSFFSIDGIFHMYISHIGYMWR